MSENITREGERIGGTPAPQRFMPYRCEVRGRENVREPLDNRIHVRLLPSDFEQEPAEMALTVHQALELAHNLIAAVSRFSERRDVRDALARTEPLYV